MPKEENEKIYYILAFLIIALGMLTFYFQSNQIGTVFTHLYYIPIIIASCWFQKKGFLIMGIMGAILLTAHYLFNSNYSYLEDVLRISVMLLITILVVKISASEKTCDIQRSAQEKNLEIAYKKLQEEDVKLKETNAQLKDKLKEVEILYKVMDHKKDKIEKI